MMVIVLRTALKIIFEGRKTFSDGARERLSAFFSEFPAMTSRADHGMDFWSRSLFGRKKILPPHLKVLWINQAAFLDKHIILFRNKRMERAFSFKAQQGLPISSN
jgi:hypothetical protein